jgi:electron transfer flavoprotein beta subunit
MKILVTIKRVVDANVRVRVKPDNTGVETTNIKMAINPFDEIAVEEAVRLKEKKIATEVVVVSIGNDSVQESIRSAMALGADRGILIKTNDAFEPLSVAKILQQVVNKEQPQLVVMGKQAIDGDNNQTGQMLAALLDWPQGSFVSKVVIENNEAIVTREIDGGLETLALQLPAVITTDLRLNQPRYATLPNIMQAKRKPLDVIMLEEIDFKPQMHAEIISVESPPTRKGGKILQSAADLVDKLKNESGVI